MREEILTPSYYEAEPGDFLVVAARIQPGRGQIRYVGAASALAGNPYHVIGWEFDSAYLRRCRPVPVEHVPAVWQQALVGYITEESRA